jgi:DMSO/TMAO reductase YedYZ molybdopterin-dependent catalytic subunit
VNVPRRDFVAALLAAGIARAEDIVPFADYGSEFEVDAQSDNPRVRMFDWRRLRDGAPGFFVFHQTKTVDRVNLDGWQLHIGGSVGKPLALAYADLRRRPQIEVGAAIECSGNSGHPSLMNGLVGSARWRGPALAPLLRECGVLPEAREVVFFGLDTESERKWPARDREFTVPHGRSLFVQDALETNALLALDMNGRPLAAEHGFPARLVVPGWYGMTQVKWLSRIVVLDRRYEGRHMARNYHSISETDGLPLETSISRMRLKSVVALVTRGNGSYRVHGAVWSGTEAVSKVEVRIGGGAWREAALEAPSSRWEWRLWSFDWLDAGAGEHTIVSRAVGTRGSIQPSSEEWRRQFASSREDNSQWPRRVVLG